MNNRLFLLLILSSYAIHAQFVDFNDQTRQNRFLGPDISACSIHANGSKNNYLKAYTCGNSSISDFLNLNFLNPELLGQQFYLYNNFTYSMSHRSGMGNWNGKDAAVAKKAARSAAEPDTYFSGTGIFMIVLGTTSYLQQIVAPKKTCPAGQTLVVAQLKYNDGNSISCWSQDAVCMAPTNTFSISITSDQDDSVPTKSNSTTSTDVDAQGINWMKDAGPAANYLQAGDSPRKIRLVVK